MKLLLDMNIPAAWLPVLAAAGVESVHWRSVGAANAPDVLIMEWARVHHYSVFTHDLDYSALLFATRASAPSVIQIRAQDIRPEAASAYVLFALRNASAAIEKGALLTIDPRKHRIHFLPLRPTPDP